MARRKKYRKRRIFPEKMVPTGVAEREQRVPPRDMPADDICSAFSAAIQLQVYTSAVTKAITEGLIDGGKYCLPGKVQAIHWVNLSDLRKLLPDKGGGWTGAEMRRRREFLKLHGREKAEWLQNYRSRPTQWRREFPDRNQDHTYPPA